MSDELTASRARWKRRAKLFQEAYKDRDFEAFALMMQKAFLKGTSAKTILQLRSLLAQAQEQVCSNLCPSVWKTGERPPHSELCRQITAALSGEKEAQ